MEGPHTRAKETLPLGLLSLCCHSKLQAPIDSCAFKSLEPPTRIRSQHLLSRAVEKQDSGRATYKGKGDLAFGTAVSMLLQLPLQDAGSD